MVANLPLADDQPPAGADVAVEDAPEHADIRSARPPILSRRVLRRSAVVGARTATLIMLDILGLALGLYGALVARWLYYEHSLFWRDPWKAEANWLPFLILITVLVFWRNGLYGQREFRGGLGSIVSSLLLVAVLALAFGIGTGYPFHSYALAPTAVAAAAVLIGALRACYDAVTDSILRSAGVRRRAVLVGSDVNVAHLRGVLGSGDSGIAYAFVGEVAPSSGDAKLPARRWLNVLQGALVRTQVDEVIVADAALDELDLLEIVEQAHRHGAKVRIAPTLIQPFTQRAEYVPGQAVPLLELRPSVFVGTQWVVKRTFDLAVSAMVVVLGLPLWLAIAVAIKLTSTGPVFFRDRRVGLGEREFWMVKFRTMSIDAAERQPALEQANDAHGPLFKIKNDPRLTSVGRLIRKYSLDEIPQVLNVLRGEMSLVGPRPLPIRDHVQLEPWHRKRYSVLPGMTGLWQVSGRIELPFDDLVWLDFYYIENWSIWSDITILAKTVPVVLGRRGAY